MRIDSKGNISPYIDVPTATYYEYATLKEGYSYAWSFGHQDDFTSEKLQQIMGCRTATKLRQTSKSLG
ncbi:Uncharacterised protein [Mycobacteroides abscessus subsp. abscessus]|nr:Uncharacterised protein [Mycobacteroides abscessus subsp. abscessus]